MGQVHRKPRPPHKTQHLPATLTGLTIYIQILSPLSITRMVAPTSSISAEAASNSHQAISIYSHRVLILSGGRNLALGVAILPMG